GSGSLSSRDGNARTVRNRTGYREERQKEFRALAIRLSEIHATDVSGIRRAFASMVQVGQSALRTSQTAPQEPQCCSSGTGLQMDPNPVSLLERPATLSG